MSTTQEPTLFGIPLNRLVAFLGPYIAIGAGAIADWLLVHVHLLGLFHTTHNQITSVITQVSVFGVTAVVVWLGHQKWLEGYQLWAYNMLTGHDSQPLTLHKMEPITLSGPHPDDVDEDNLPGDELPPQAEDFPVTDPSTIPTDVGDGEVAKEMTTDGPSLAEALGPLSSGSVSGLSYKHRIRCRDLVMEAAFLGLKHAAALHYTQGGSRWQGIRNKLKAWRGKYPHYADCSAFATWCLWQGLSHYGVRDVVNGQNWQGGYTGTMVAHGKRVVHEGNIMRGDLALYGDPFGGTGHVAVCIGGGKVISFGSEAGPFLLDLHYRPDLREVRRYI